VQLNRCKWQISGKTIYKQGDNNIMRYIFLLLVFWALLLCGIGCVATGQGSAIESMEASETRVYEVFGMNCPGCHGGLEKLVRKIPAIQQAEANWLKKQLVITVRPGTELNDEDIYDAIRRANFTPGKRIK
jgi:copper chaperone CopZ